MAVTNAAPVVSVCIPAYNQEQFIAQAVESVLAQTFADFELIVVDDASPDRTFEIVQSYRDPRIRVMRNPHNLGLEGNWNAALAQARGAWIKILCGDDLLYPRCLERQLRSVRERAPSPVLISCSRDIITPAGRKICTRRFARHDGSLSGMKAIRRNIRSGTNLIGEPAAVLFRADVVAASGPFYGGLPYLIDLDMWVRILLQGDFVHLAEPLLAFRVSSGSLSFALANRQSREYRQFIDRIRCLPDMNGIGGVDAAVGKIMSRGNMLLRKVFYAWYLARCTADNSGPLQAGREGASDL